MLYDVTLSVLQVRDVGLTVPQWPVANAQSSNAVLKARPFIRRERERERDAPAAHFSSHFPHTVYLFCCAPV